MVKGSSSNNFLTGFRSLPLLIGLMIVISFYDLVSPPLATTIWRQTQTAMLTENFVKEGFSFSGLYVGLKGREKLMMVYEFPIYNAIVGVFFKFFGPSAFWGKLVSLVASITSLFVFNRLLKSVTNHTFAFLASLFFVLLPVDVLMFTAFQPDALGLMFLIISIWILNRWRQSHRVGLTALFSFTLLMCGFCKYPIFVPFIPLFFLMYFFPQGRLRLPKVTEILIVTIIFILPFICWYLYRSRLTDPELVVFETKMFLLGDLMRFFTRAFYMKPATMFLIFVVCGTGCIYFASGLIKLSTKEIVLVSGIPLYYILVPTVADQAYYLYAISFLAAYFMAKGALLSYSYIERRKVRFAAYLLGVLFTLFSAFGIIHILRQDKVMVPLANQVKKRTKQTDLIYAISMHDRGVYVGGYNPSVQYFTQRNGWNVMYFKPDNFQGIIDDIEAKRAAGAKWLLVTWYTPALEPWYINYFPAQFSRYPGYDSQAIAQKLRNNYRIEYLSDNFEILNLAK